MTATVNPEKLNASLRYLDKLGEMNLHQLQETDPEQAKKLEKLSALFLCEDFRNQLAACTDKQTAVRLFAENDFPLTEEEATELNALYYSIAKKLVDNDGELNEEDLEQICGGAILGGIAGGILGGLLGCAVGFIFGGPGTGVVIGIIVGVIVGGFFTDV